LGAVDNPVLIIRGDVNVHHIHSDCHCDVSHTQ
jgi:hypothetical protein